MKANVLIFGSIALAFLLVSIPMLASFPQNPDGAELLLTAVHGGVLHPPGFPVQSWLNRIVIGLYQTVFMQGSLPGHDDNFYARILSSESLVCFSISLFFLGLTLRQLGAEVGGAILGVVCFAFYPPAWKLAVQPEKYAQFFFLVSIFAFYAFRFDGKSSSLWIKKTCLLALFFGLLISHTFVGIFALPLIFAAASTLPRSRRLGAGLVFGAGVFVVAGAFYLSLLTLTRPDLWPDWGKLSSLRDLAAHLLRLDNGLFTLDPTPRPGVRAIEVAYEEMKSSFSLGLLLLPLGIGALWKQRHNENARSKIFAWGLTLLATISFIIKAKTGGYSEIAMTWLERHTAVPMFFLAAVFAFGWDELVQYLPPKYRSWNLIFVALFAVILATHSFSAVDASKDATADLYSRALGGLLPTEAVYISGDDMEFFYGATQGSVRRFPVSGEYPWLREKVLPKREPRLTYPRPARPFQLDLENIQRALNLGLPVYSTNILLFEQAGLHPVRRGLFWVVDPRQDIDSARETFEAAITLCSYLKNLSFDPPKAGHYYSRYIWQMFALAFMDTSEELQQAGHSQGVAETANIANTILQMSPAPMIAKACEELHK